MVRLQDNVRCRQRTEQAENPLICAVIPIYVENNKIGIESRYVLLGGADQVLRCESA